MRKLNPEHIAAVIGILNAVPFIERNGMAFDSIEPDRCIMRAQVMDFHLPPFGRVHGGLYATLIDIAGFWAAYCSIGDSHSLISLDVNIKYLSNVSSGTLIATASLVKAGSRVCHSHVSVRSEDGLLLADGNTTLLVMAAPQFSPLSVPAKFLA